ncbi:MAG: TRAP transporter small permease, partial [Geminicoccaceae bacterium]
MYDGKKREASHGIQEVRQAFVRPPMNFIAGMESLFARLNDRLLAICKGLIIAIVAVLAVILIAAVFYRFALDNAISWSEEGSNYLMVWLTFLGAPIAL